MRVSVVIPAYNEAATIGELVAEVRRILPDGEIIVVDDASRDGTGAAARHAGARVISHPYNIGNGAAVKTGIRAATGDIVVLMDGDGQHNPADIPRLLNAIETSDMAVAARDPATHANIWRRFANACYNLLASYVTQTRIQDLTSGFRALHRDVALRYLYLLPNTFSYPTTITLAYLRSGRSIVYVPAQTRQRRGKSKIRPLHDGINFLLIIIKIATLFSPLVVFLPVSFFFFMTGIIYYLYTFIVMHRFTNMSTLLILTSVLIFLMGLISEQITQLRYDRIENGG
ncbi:MAG: glycosyltransferase family 2 protein [Desulfobacterota bacterium]|nr:glycosyltransferase family 2 protein [Thermodesulfobacteriota bacterium]